MKWLDVVVAVSAIFISVVSLVVSIEHGRTMEKMVDQNERMVEANTMPMLSASLDYTYNKKMDRVELQASVKNSGVGPAMIDRFRVFYQGKRYAVKDVNVLLNTCCTEEMKKHEVVQVSSVSGSTVPAGASSNFLTIPLLHAPSLQGAEGMSSGNFSFEACYCSVLDKCWETNFDQRRPTPVPECKVAPDEKLW